MNTAVLHRLIPAVGLALALCYAQVTAQPAAATDVITNGDLNRDGVFDIFDIMRLERTVSLGMGADAEELSAGDVDGNGRLDKFDLLVLKEAMSRVNDGMSMFNAVKGSIEDDLSRTSDNVETYLDLARFYGKEQMYQRSRDVLESVLEALEPDHPLFNQVVGQINATKQSQMREMEEAEDFLNQDAYQAAGDLAGKTSLRRAVVQLKGKLSKLLNDQKFAAHYNSKRVKSQLGDVMDNMLRTINKDQMIDAGAFDQFNTEVQGVLTNPENIVKQLDSQGRSRIKNIVESSTGGMRQDALRLRQNYVRSAGATGSSGGRTGMGEAILNRDKSRLEGNFHVENMAAQGRVPANAPLLEPDTISIITPQYKLSWEVSNILGAKNTALEISKANAKFSNPRGTEPDPDATLSFIPALGTVKGERRGSALELEGVGTYYYRVAALNARGELISRFSDATKLVVVYNNLNIAANKPVIEPKIISEDSPEYSFRWDVSFIEGARDAAVEITKPDRSFGNPGGRARDRQNTFFFNPSLGRISGTFSSSIDGLSGPGTYLFRVIAVSPQDDFMGMWSEPETLVVATGSGEIPQPAEGETDQQPREPTEIPPSPQLESSDNGFSVNWNVEEIATAKGVSFELARLVGGSAANASEVDEVVVSQLLENPSGDFEIESGLIDKPGRYQARLAAVDSAGNLLSGWSEPSYFSIKSPGFAKSSTTLSSPAAAQAQPSAQEPDTTGSSQTNTATEQEPQAAEQVQKAQPSGKNLVVTRNNEPLYEQNNPSSPEIASLQKGDKLIHVSSDGLWYRVYYPLGLKYGWVLSFSVSPPGN